MLARPVAARWVAARPGQAVAAALLLLGGSKPATAESGSSPPAGSAAAPGPPATPAAAAGSDSLLAELEAAEAADAAVTAKTKGADATAAADQRKEDPLEWLPQGAREVVGNEANPAMSIILDVAGAAFSTDRRHRSGGHAPVDNGPMLQGVELAASAPIDPFFRADLMFNVAHLELEQAYLTTTALPLNLQLRAGQLKSSIGRFNQSCLHQWHFVTHPLPNEFLFGAEGLGLPGAELSVLVPLPWFVEVSGALQVGDAGSFRTPLDRAPGFGDFVYPLRLVQFFDVSDDTAIQAGLNAVLGRSQSHPELGNRAHAYGSDLMLKWRPIGPGETGYTYVAWTTEAWLRQMEVANDLWKDAGGHSDLVFGIAKEWEAAARVELWKRLSGRDDNPEIDRNAFGRDTVRASAAGTYMPSHFSRIRLQYTFAHLSGFDDAHVGLLQLEVSAGAHGAHEY